MVWFGREAASCVLEEPHYGVARNHVRAAVEHELGRDPGPVEEQGSLVKQSLSEMNPVLSGVNDFTSCVVEMRSGGRENVLAIFLSLMVKSKQV